MRPSPRKSPQRSGGAPAVEGGCDAPVAESRQTNCPRITRRSGLPASRRQDHTAHPGHGRARHSVRAARGTRAHEEPAAFMAYSVWREDLFAPLMTGCGLPRFLPPTAVAQIGNLPYRRLEIGRARPGPWSWCLARPADCQSAPCQKLCHDAPLPTPFPKIVFERPANLGQDGETQSERTFKTELFKPYPSCFTP